MEDALIDTGKKNFDAWRDGFPNKYLTTSVGRINNAQLSPHAGNGGYIATQVVDYAATKGPVAVAYFRLHPAAHRRGTIFTCFPALISRRMSGAHTTTIR